MMQKYTLIEECPLYHLVPFIPVSCHVSCVFVGNIPTSPVGQVGVEDPDIIEDKTYTIPPGEEFPEYFSVSATVLPNTFFFLGIFI